MRSPNQYQNPLKETVIMKSPLDSRPVSAIRHSGKKLNILDTRISINKNSVYQRESETNIISNHNSGFNSVINQNPPHLQINQSPSQRIKKVPLVRTSNNSNSKMYSDRPVSNITNDANYGHYYR